MLYYLLSTVYVFVCFVLLLVILLQQGKGGDMASAFGGGSSQTAFGARGGATLLSRLTTAFAVVFMLGALALAIMGQRGPGSVVGSAPAAPPSNVPRGPAPTPTGTAPTSTTPAQQKPVVPPVTPTQPPAQPAPEQPK